MARYLFTSESVSQGHPDKVSDQISDAILDAIFAQDPYARVACETLCTTDLIVLGGELRVAEGVDVDYEKVARDVVRDIGYTSDDVGFNADTCKIENYLHEQSADIAMGVDKDGAGDQGLMFGYASNQTQEFMPVPIALAHRILSRLTEVRKSGEADWLRPDSKSQVTVDYDGYTPMSIPAVVVSTQHAENVTQKQIREYVIENVIKPSIPAHMLSEETVYHINPTGQFIIGGPHGDCGLTGRKIIVDTYGGWGRHGGGAFSGKDPTKVDRSAAYMARYIAKNIVAAGLAAECEVQLAYAIGVAEPVSVLVNTFETGTVDEDKIEIAIRELFPLTPKGIIETLDLRRPIYRKTAWGGHFGRSEPEFTWEAVNKVSELRQAVGLASETPNIEFAIS